MINHISIRSRLLNLTILPIVLLSSIILVLVFQRISSITEYSVEGSRKLLVESRKNELKNILATAYSGISELYESGAPRDAGVEELKQISFGKDGYIFGYDKDAIRVFSGNSDKSIGKSYYNYKDVNGVYLIRELIEAGKTNQLGSGNQFVTYHFPRLNSEIASEKLSYSIFLPKWDLMIGVGLYVDRIDEQMSVMEGDIYNYRRELMKWLFGVTAFLAFLFISLSILFTRAIVNPLSTVTESIKAIANGEGDLSKRLKVNGNDELASLAFHVNQMLDILSGMIRELQQIGADVSGEAHQLSGQAESILAISTNQDKEVEQVTTAVVEMTQASCGVAKNTEQAAQSAQKANKLGEDVKKNIESSFKEMEKLEMEISNASEVIENVGSSVENISNVLQVIESIASQTNLLALNAAIEAARAGEQGRGFAVVADEVRTLASRTQGSTEEIQQMIASLEKGAQMATEVMSESSRRSRLTDESFHKTADALNEIVESVASISDMNVQVAAAAEEQNVVGEHISQRIVEISNQTNQNKEIAGLNQAAVSVLNGQVNQLNNIIGKFRL